MKFVFVLSLLTLVVFSHPISAQKARKKSAPSQPQSSEFLTRRLPTGVMTGTFNSFASLLYAVDETILHTDSKDVGSTELHSVFPEFYKPTYREFFDAIARQTQSTWQPDPAHKQWFFSPPAAPLPYSIKLAQGWSSHDEGMYVGYVPPTAPVGMDVYMMGTYSANPPNATTLMKNVRSELAIQFARNVKPGVTPKDMKKVQIAGAEALYFEAPSPRPGTMWRQWAFLKNGQAFVIVSVVAKDDRQVWTDVDAMVSSFQVAP